MKISTYIAEGGKKEGKTGIFERNFTKHGAWRNVYQNINIYRDFFWGCIDIVRHIWAIFNIQNVRNFHLSMANNYFETLCWKSQS